MSDQKDCHVQKISLLFLDVDGVLNINDKDKKVRQECALLLSREMIERLKFVIDGTNFPCKICISSAWRLNKYSLQHLKKHLLAIADIDDNIIIGQTPSIPFDQRITNVLQQRCEEIQRFLNHDRALQSSFCVMSFCVIDDLDLREIGKDHFVHIDPKYGLCDTDVNRTLSILNQVTCSIHDNASTNIIANAKPSTKLLFIAASQAGYDNMNVQRLSIIMKKSQCMLVMVKHDSKHALYANALHIDDFTNIVQFISNLERTYNLTSFAILDYMNLHSKYANMAKLFLRRFVKVDPMQGLVLNDVLDAVSLLNKWSF
mmetsp:Transcript_28907/g.47339  ORF Transcript_28907/g.47339 Transcript_28907/m.47339 type:complete len:316 (+) Transcript_28907:37-984(+)|eukprot:CAMPEP_0202686416 /NCGR_PEP_ID=MMETSP1385-20130828/2208_1 /ASSEMBLY_ACC=CAM_ASM_000861 /TAXON_ID=933848 /ORGANISM="Elphidium margaritaceum" /LENGTH=315 /DNA_ID=CAMNT_0049340987 /DNA_START=37 /DNA_END=984 /DNA_ORIENTATION=-